MTEDLWYHALKFLDKYRTDVSNYDIEELYEFSDKTGILERHRHLLQKPFLDSQVDMKIMYYELIKMLIDYERTNQPDTFDATKTVGKIEGYQELTNKLQRYLNQRFIIDIDKINKTQTNINQIFSEDGSGVLQRIEQLEVKMVKLEATNKSLLEDISILRQQDKELEGKIVTQQLTLENKLQKELQTTEDRVSDKFKHFSEKMTSFEVLTNNLGEQINTNENDCKRVENHFTNLYNQQKEEIDETIQIQISPLLGDIKTVHENREQLQKQLEANTVRVDLLEKSNPEFTRKLAKDIDQKLSLHKENMNDKVKVLESNILKNETSSIQIKDNVKQNQKEITRILGEQTSFISEHSSLVSKSDATWKHATDAIQNQQNTITEIQTILGDNETKFDQINNETISQLNSLTDGVKKAIHSSEGNSNDLKDISDKLSKHNDMFDGFDNEFETAKDRIRKFGENVEVVTKTLGTFENRHLETVERMKEVTVLASTTQLSVQNFEQRLDQEKSNYFNQFMGQLQELRQDQTVFSNKIGEIDDDNQTLLDKLNGLENNIDSRFKSLDEVDKDIMSKFSKTMGESGDLIQNAGENIRKQQEKIIQLEDAHQNHVQKLLYVDSLSNRMNQIEASHQQSDAKVKDEVDASLVKNQNILDEIKQEIHQQILMIENQMHKNNQSFETRNDMMKLELDQQARKLKTYEETITSLNQDNETNLNKIGDIKTNMSNKFNDLTSAGKELASQFKELEELTKENRAKIVMVDEENKIQITQHNEVLATKGELMETKTTKGLRELEERNKQEFLSVQNLIKKEIQDLVILQSQSKNELKEEMDQNIQIIQTDMATVNQTVINVNKQSIELKAQIQSNLEQTALKLTEELSKSNLSEFQSLKAQISSSLEESKENTLENDNHVKNLRDLNGKLINQVKEKLSAHTTQQDSTIENLTKDNEKLFTTFQAEIGKELSHLQGVTNAHAKNLSKYDTSVKTLSEKMVALDNEIKWKDEREVIKSMIKGNENTSNMNMSSIDDLNKLITDIDTRHTETVERMKEIVILVNQFELQTKEIGHAFKEDQRKELKSIENQLNTIYTEYEKIEKSMSDIKNKNHELQDNEKKNEDDLQELKEIWDVQHNQLLSQTNEQGDLILKTDSKILKIMEQASTLMVNDVNKEKSISVLETTITDLEKKLKDLESADIFLQESCRQATEKTISLENVTKKSEDELTSLYKQQQDDIEGKLKLQIAAILKDVGNLTEEKNKMADSLMDTKDSIDNRFGDLNKTLNGFELTMGDSMKESQDFKERLISLQFQAEKAQQVETLASRVNQIDESHQRSEEKNRQEYETSVKHNWEVIQELQRMLKMLEDDFEAEVISSKSNNAELANQLKNLSSDTEDHEKTLSSLGPFTKVLDNKVIDLEGKIKDQITLLISKTEEHRSLIEKSSSSISSFYEKIVTIEKDKEELSSQVITKTAEDINKLRNEIEDKFIGINFQVGDQSAQLQSIVIKINGTKGETDMMMEDFDRFKSDFGNLQKTVVRDSELIVKSIAEQQGKISSLDESFDMIEKAQINENKKFELIMEKTEDYDERFDKVVKLIDEMERFGNDQNSLILAVEKTVNDKLNDVDVEFKGMIRTNTNEFQKIRNDTTGDKENLWTLIVEIYSAFRGSTVVLKSEGVVKTEQADVLGVYRMVDSYNDRPVYKQEAGENYIYYSSASSAWMVGTVVGHQYGWLRNSSSSASTSRWLPDLRSGWEYRPLIRQSDSLEYPNSTNSWKSDDGTLRIESLRDVEKVNEVIRDIRNSREVD